MKPDGPRKFVYPVIAQRYHIEFVLCHRDFGGLLWTNVALELSDETNAVPRGPRASNLLLVIDDAIRACHRCLEV